MESEPRRSGTRPPHRTYFCRILDERHALRLCLEKTRNVPKTPFLVVDRAAHAALNGLAAGIDELPTRERSIVMGVHPFDIEPVPRIPVLELLHVGGKRLASAYLCHWIAVAHVGRGQLRQELSPLCIRCRPTARVATPKVVCHRRLPFFFLGVMGCSSERIAKLVMTVSLRGDAPNRTKTSTPW